ncbi:MULTISPECIES: YidH family protein [Thermomonospora]|uniref:DUF202 domain-containing protein n=1 Tax=Thermomonospora curvata (strain ATCC 19995 / DSM 43183 / JCM 3096 / KCTC 9072 / NBRC 15933 / NCIMB 10081 / Henssen B9) TaxID=471852 RepID=D1A5Z2_THECD|nr:MULTISPECIES: DUF202 domain-containing protein [Thermomonospora]ACY98287.1 protein of unknown function DUF202 [Thermomonospora curvata DSM 43183]PKK13456.1 MAG: DUF202 domain-containing protein [Thermomonospora sp. CIF 1]
MSGPGHGEPHAGEQEPDYRFSLANERTFLAYMRTALAVDVGGLAVVQLLPDVATAAWRRGVAVALALLGLVLAVAGYRRWSQNQRAMRRGEPLPESWLMPMLATAAALASAAVVVLVAL